MSQNLLSFLIYKLFFRFLQATEPQVDSHLLNVVNMTEGRVQWYLNKLDQGTKRDEYGLKIIRLYKNIENS